MSDHAHFDLGAYTKINFLLVVLHCYSEVQHRTQISSNRNRKSEAKTQPDKSTALS